MNGTVEILVSLDLLDSWNEEIAASTRANAQETAALRGGTLLAGDPEFILGAPEYLPGTFGDVARVRYRMVK